MADVEGSTGEARRGGEDLAAGPLWTGRPIVMDRDEILAFARAFDPQDMHLDEGSDEAAAFGGIIASGWHVAALAMRDMVETSPFGAAPILGMGADGLRWLKPVRPGDTLVAVRTIDDVRASRSRPDVRIVLISTTIRNQREEEVMRFSATIRLPAEAEI